MRVPQLVLNVVLAPLLILGAIVLVNKWIANKPVPQARKPPSTLPKVAYLESRPAEHAPSIVTFGHVQPYQQTQLASQVAGRITSISDRFQAGESVAAGEILVTIDQADFLAAIELQKSALATAQRTLAEEESRSRIALDDWIDTGRSPEEAPPFTLRKPQLTAALADVAAATASLAKANLDLERTEIRAPFAAIVSERAASPGNVITTNSVLGALIDRERTEVRLPLTPEQASRLALPLSFALDPNDLPALTTTLRTPSQPGASWSATITRTEPSLDADNQVVFVVAEIPKPFDDPAAFLPLGAYVEARITGKPIPDVHRLPESSLLEDRYVWILGAEDKLHQQPVQRLFSADGYFLAKVSEPLAPEPLRVATRPLVSFTAGDRVVPVDPNPPPSQPEAIRHDPATGPQ